MDFTAAAAGAAAASAGAGGLWAGGGGGAGARGGGGAAPGGGGTPRDPPPPRLGEGVDERDGGSALPLLPYAPAGRHDVEDDDLAVLQTPELVGGQPDGVGLRGRASDNEQGDE